MKYRRLGRTGLRVSVIGLGTWQFGGEWAKSFSHADVARIIDASADVGINLIDTAECYGASEDLLGGALVGRRQNWIIATKFGHRYHGVPERSEHFGVRDVIGQLETSLRALRTDYVDLYQFHSGGNAAFEQPELWAALQEKVRAGVIRFLGISLKDTDDFYQTTCASSVQADVVQVVYNRLQQTPERRVLPSCMEQDLGVLARVPLERGFLSGKYPPGARFSALDVRSTYDQEEVQRKLVAVEEIKRTEVPAGVDMSVWALGWCLFHPAVTAVLPGCKSAEQIRENAQGSLFASVDHPQAVR